MGRAIILRLSSALPAVLLAGCAQTVYVYPEITIPPAPVLPTVVAESLACLSDEDYESLAVRDALRRGYAEQLRAIIAEHNRRQE